MSYKTLLLVRHGATDANVARPYTLQGLRPDPDLNTEGIHQAQATATALERWPLARVITSPLRRARETAAVIGAHLNLPLEVEEHLVEVDVGSWSGLSWEEVEFRWPQEYRHFHDDPEHHGYAMGESLGQVRDRVLPAISAILHRCHESAILIVGHGVVNRVLMAYWLGLPLRHARQLPQNNGGINVITIHEGKARVRTVNAADHLPGTALHPDAG